MLPEPPVIMRPAAGRICPPTGTKFAKFTTLCRNGTDAMMTGVPSVKFWRPATKLGLVVDVLRGTGFATSAR